MEALLLSLDGKMELMKSIGSNDSDENGSPPFCPPLSRCCDWLAETFFFCYNGENETNTYSRVMFTLALCMRT